MLHLIRALAISALACAAVSGSAAGEPFALRTNDVVAWVGGSDVAAAQFTGHLETLLSVRFPGAHFRNFGWEGDTVFSQPRDINFPSVLDQLKRARATVVFLQFGRGEALEDTKANFAAAYERLAYNCARVAGRIVLVAPAPFENGEPPLPDLSHRNPVLAANVKAIHAIAAKRHWMVIDAFAELAQSNNSVRLTSDGLNLTPRGQALFAASVARQLGAEAVVAHAGQISLAGAWANPQFEALRQQVIEKDRLWFNYWRPQNWAFLGGDRVSQPSSRDHINPSIRWFPAEMEKYVPLIQAQEKKVEEEAKRLR